MASTILKVSVQKDWAFLLAAIVLQALALAAALRKPNVGSGHDVAPPATRVRRNAAGPVRIERSHASFGPGEAGMPGSALYRFVVAARDSGIEVLLDEDSPEVHIEQTVVDVRALTRLEWNDSAGRDKRWHLDAYDTRYVASLTDVSSDPGYADMGEVLDGLLETLLDLRRVDGITGGIAVDAAVQEGSPPLDGYAPLPDRMTTPEGGAIDD